MVRVLVLEVAEFEVLEAALLQPFLLFFSHQPIDDYERDSIGIPSIMES